MRLLVIPDGRSLKTTSSKRYHLVIQHAQTGKLIRYTSSDHQMRIIALMAGDMRGAVETKHAWLIDLNPEARHT